MLLFLLPSLQLSEIFPNHFESGYDSQKEENHEQDGLGSEILIQIVPEGQSDDDGRDYVQSHRACGAPDLHDICPSTIF